MKKKIWKKLTAVCISAAMLLCVPIYTYAEELSPEEVFTSAPQAGEGGDTREIFSSEADASGTEQPGVTVEAEQDRPDTDQAVQTNLAAASSRDSEQADGEVYIPYIITGYLPDGKIGAAYSVQLEGTSNNEQSLKWSIKDENTLPKGISLTPDGLLTGMPEERGDFDIVVIADNGQAVSEKSFELAIKEADPVILPYGMKFEEDTADMGVVPSGHTGSSIIKIDNTGQNPLHMKPLPECANFILSWEKSFSGTIEPGHYQYLHMVSKENLPDGFYQDKVRIETQEGLSAEVTMKVNIGPASDKDYDLDISNTDITIGDWIFDPNQEFWIIIKNIGKKPTKITRDTSKLVNFRVYNNSIEAEEEDCEDVYRTLQPGERIFLYISVIELFGSFEEQFYLYTDDGSEFPITIRQNIEKPAEPEHLEKYVKMTPAEVRFNEGYAFYEKLPEAQTITVENKASKAVNLSQQGVDGLKISKLSKYRLEPGEKAEFTVQPVLGLSPDSYSWWIKLGVKSDSGQTTYIRNNIKFNVSTANFEGANKIPEVKGLTNGTEKTSQGLKLPDSVSVKGAEGESFWADVLWYPENSDYDPKLKEEQNFIVKGQLQIPPEQNNKHLDTAVEIQVQVLAYNPLARPVFDKVTVTNNYLEAALYDKSNEATGYQFVLVKNEKNLDKNIFAKEVNSTATSVTIKSIQKGDYFLHCRAYKKEAGKTVHGQWSEGKPISIAVVTGKAPKISKATVKNCDVRFTISIPDKATGFDAVLAKKKSGTEPMDYTIVKRNQSAKKKTLVLNGAAKGTYYVAVHSYTIQNHVKIFSPWSNLLKVTVKNGKIITAPVVKKVSVSRRNVTVTFSRAKGTAGSDWMLGTYVGYDQDGSYNVVSDYKYKQKNKTATKITFSNVKPGTYYLIGHAYKKDFVKNYTNWSKIRKVIVK